MEAERVQGLVAHIKLSVFLYLLFLSIAYFLYTFFISPFPQA